MGLRRQKAVNTMRKPLLALALLTVAVFVGFAFGWGMIMFLNAVLPPFRPEDDDTLRERIPVALTYLTWGGTTLIVLVVSWQRLRRSA